MESVGIRELKQNASAVVARAEKGETITITVQGRPVAQIGPLKVEKTMWVPAERLARVMTELGPDTTGWIEERNAYREIENDPIVDPWNDSRE
jgi:prevent-host-death family protein